jgi:hypothetical protein
MIVGLLNENCFVPFRLGMMVFRKTVCVLDVRLRAKRYGETSP